MNKKGGAFSIITWMAAAMVIVFFLAGIWYGFHIMTVAMQNAGKDMNTNIVNLTDAVNKTVGKVDNAMNSLTWISFVMIVCLAFSILIENFYIRQHPILFFVHLLVVIIGVVAAVYISNYYAVLMNTPPLNATISQFTASSYIVLYLPLWVAVIGIFGLVLLVINANRDPEIRVRGGTI